MKLTDDQQNATQQFMEFMDAPDERFMIIQGAAGSGKSTIIRHLLQMMRNRYELKDLLLPGNQKATRVTTHLTATTNKAAAVFEELLDEPAQTIHSLLKLTVMPNYNNGTMKLTPREDYNIITDSLVIIDEASFIDQPLFDYIQTTLKNCKIVLIGDYYQLAPVKMQKTIMEGMFCRKVVMSEVVRNTGRITSTGIQFRDTVETNKFTPIEPDHENVLQVDGPTFQSMVEDAFTSDEYAEDPNHAKLLAWTNKRVINYNRHIREVLGHPRLFEAGETAITNNPIFAGRFGWSTDSYVYIRRVQENVRKLGVDGQMMDLGRGTVRFCPNSQMEARMRLKQLAKAKEWQKYFDIKENWLDLRPIYASTVHKAQGSTYDTVYIDLPDIARCNIRSDVARLLYVAVSRAAKKVVLYGELPKKYGGTK